MVLATLDAELGTSFGGLGALQTLHLRSNHLASLPEGFGGGLGALRLLLLDLN